MFAVNVWVTDSPAPGAWRVAMRKFFKRLIANIDAMIWNLGGGAPLRH